MTYPLVKFGDVVRQIKDKVDPQTAGLDRYVAGEHMDTDNLHIRRWGEIGDGYLGPAFHMRFKPGQVLYGSRRTYLRKVAVADFEGITANTTYVIEPKDPEVLLPDFLPFIMQTDSFNEHSIKQSKGSVNPYINFSDITWYEFPLPPLDEQRRIADLLWTADDAIVEYEKLLDAAKVLLQSTVEETIRSAQEHNSWVKLNDLVEADKPITYGILKPGTGHPGGIPVIKVKDYPDGEIKEDNLLLTSPEIEAEYKRSRLRTGDLLISIRGTVGRLAFVPQSLNGANITQDTARLSLRNSLNHLYIRSMLESNHVQRQIKSKITGLAVQGINIGELRKIEIPLVDRTDQDKVSHHILQIRNIIKEIEEHLDLSRDLKRQILSSQLC
jgi:type I restriction enzyme, S subunit